MSIFPSLAGVFWVAYVFALAVLVAWAVAW